MKIGNIELKSNVLLAPMAGITDKTYRMICKKFGAGLVCTEMISAKGLLYNDKKTHTLMDIDVGDTPVSLQIFGSDPDIMEKIVIEKLNHMDTFQILDINMGCPAPKIVKNGDGSALMKNPKLAGEIMKRVKAASNKPVTVKFRKGWNDESINFLEIGRIAQESGIDTVILHGRTREQFYSGKADWDAIKELKENMDIPVIGNGDIFTPKDVMEMLEYTKCDGVMIGRGAFGNPWIFKNSNELIKGSVVEDRIIHEEKLRQLSEHVEMLVMEKPERVALLQMRKHAGWYIKGLHGAAEMRGRFNRVKTRDEMISLINEYIDKINRDS
jgi:tRNA-dihydrouridine synthase B